MIVATDGAAPSEGVPPASAGTRSARRSRTAPDLTKAIRDRYDGRSRRATCRCSRTTTRRPTRCSSSSSALEHERDAVLVVRRGHLVRGGESCPDARSRPRPPWPAHASIGTSFGDVAERDTAAASTPQRPSQTSASANAFVTPAARDLDQPTVAGDRDRRPRPCRRARRASRRESASTSCCSVPQRRASSTGSPTARAASAPACSSGGVRSRRHVSGLADRELLALDREGDARQPLAQCRARARTATSASRAAAAGEHAALGEVEDDGAVAADRAAVESCASAATSGDPARAARADEHDLDAGRARRRERRPRPRATPSRPSGAASRRGRSRPGRIGPARFSHERHRTPRSGGPGRSPRPPTLCVSAARANETSRLGDARSRRRRAACLPERHTNLQPRRAQKEGGHGGNHGFPPISSPEERARDLVPVRRHGLQLGGRLLRARRRRSRRRAARPCGRSGPRATRSAAFRP